MVIEKNIDEGNWKLAINNIHKTKGISGNLYIIELHRLSAELEDYLRCHNKKPPDSLWRPFSEKLNHIVKTIKTMSESQSKS